LVNSQIILKKISHVRHNLSRLREKESVSLDSLRDDMDVKDVVLHNLQLAIQGCLDHGVGF
jgi:uncharacterized protein YutE (UPF0331/DUF86 family)